MPDLCIYYVSSLCLQCFGVILKHLCEDVISCTITSLISLSCFHACLEMMVMGKGRTNAVVVIVLSLAFILF